MMSIIDIILILLHSKYDPLFILLFKYILDNLRDWVDPIPVPWLLIHADGSLLGYGVDA